MALTYMLPNGEEVDLLGVDPLDMEYLCLVCGEFKTPLSELIAAYKEELNALRRQKIADEIRDQAYYYAGQVGSFDEDLQQMISWDELGEQIYQHIMNYINDGKRE